MSEKKTQGCCCSGKEQAEHKGGCCSGKEQAEHKGDCCSSKEQAEHKGDCGQSKGKSAHGKKKSTMPQIDFSTFMISLASSALVHLGEVPNPEDGESTEDLELAAHSIDLIEMLKEKVENGVTVEEKRLLEDVLYELRMKYVLKKK